MSNSDAWKRFHDSMVMDFEKWHDGTGYDLEAFDELTPEEKESVLSGIRSKSDRDWRDVELLEREGSVDSIRAIQQNLAGSSIDTHSAALEALIDRGELSDELIDEKLAPLLGHTAPFDALDRCLRLAEEHPGPKVKVALLRNTRRRPEVGVHFAALLFYQAGLAKEAFDWDHRPFFLKFGTDVPRQEQEAAFSELCRLVGVDEADV